MVNQQDKNPGKIQELVIGVKDGRLVYVVLSIGGFLGMVNKLFALPWKAFQFHAEVQYAAAMKRNVSVAMQHFFSSSPQPSMGLTMP